MGIYPQPNDWACGPYALKYALLLPGIPGDEGEIARIAGTDRHGSDEVDLARAARRYGCDLRLVRHSSPEESRTELVRHAEARIPVLLCVHGWEHWVTATGTDRDEFVVLDGRDPAVLSVVPWPRLREILVHREAAPDTGRRAIYDLHPLVPRVRSPFRARLSAASVRYLRDPRNRTLALAWGRYVADLLSVGTAPAPQYAFSLTLGDLIRRRSADVLRRARAVAGPRDELARQRVLENICFVADTYDLRVPLEREQQAVDAVSRLVTKRASGRSDDGCRR